MKIIDYVDVTVTHQSQDTDSHAALKDTFDSLKAECLAFQSYQR